MSATILSLLLSAQLLVSTPPAAATLSCVPQTQVQETRLWWGLIDPELSLWFCAPRQEEDQADAPVLWDFSWRSLWAAIFRQPLVKEAAYAPRA